jgi:hypothetical protein
MTSTIPCSLFPIPCSLTLSSAVGDRRQLVEYFSVLE